MCFHYCKIFLNTMQGKFTSIVFILSYRLLQFYMSVLCPCSLLLLIDTEIRKYIFDDTWTFITKSMQVLSVPVMPIHVFSKPTSNKVTVTCVLKAFLFPTNPSKKSRFKKYWLCDMVICFWAIWTMHCINLFRQRM